MICDYGCGQKAKYQFKNGKWCCEENWKRCQEMRNNYSEKIKKYWKKYKNKKIQSNRKKEYWIDEENIKKLSKRMKTYWNDYNNIKKNIQIE